MNHNYTVGTLMSIYSQSLNSSLDAQLVTIEGFYFDQGGKLYGKVYYDRLQSKDKKNQITIQLPYELKSTLVSQRFYQLQGYVNKAQAMDNNSRLKIYFRVTKVLKHEEDIQLISKPEYDIVRDRFDREFPMIEDVLVSIIEKGNSPVIDMVIGEQSTSLDDYAKQLSAKEYYEIRHHRCNLSSQTEMLRFMENHNFSDTDILVFVRGGGSGLEVFNEIELCKKAIGLPIPFITGIGHDSDITLLQRVADKSFSTPTAVGVFLQKMVDVYIRRKRSLDNKEAQIDRIQRESEKDRIILTTEIENNKNKLQKFGLFLVIMGALIIGLIVLLLF